MRRSKIRPVTIFLVQMQGIPYSYSVYGAFIPILPSISVSILS